MSCLFRTIYSYFLLDINSPCSSLLLFNEWFSGPGQKAAFISEETVSAGLTLLNKTVVDLKTPDLPQLMASFCFLSWNRLLAELGQCQKIRCIRHVRFLFTDVFISMPSNKKIILLIIHPSYLWKFPIGKFWCGVL